MLTPNGRFATNTKLCLRCAAARADPLLAGGRAGSRACTHLPGSTSPPLYAICRSMSDFHPESWNPMWSVSTILTGLLSFMGETQHTTGAAGQAPAAAGGAAQPEGRMQRERRGPVRCDLRRHPRSLGPAADPSPARPAPPPATGAITSTPDEKRRYARESLAYNVRNPTFRKLFPEWVKRHEEGAQQAQAQQQAQQQQQQQQQPGAPAAPVAGVAAPPGQQQQQQQAVLGGPGGNAAAGEQRWSGLLVGAAAVAAAGVAATLLMKPEGP